MEQDDKMKLPQIKTQIKTKEDIKDKEIRGRKYWLRKKWQGTKRKWLVSKGRKKVNYGSLGDTWYLFNKYWITLRMPMATLFTIIQPLYGF